MSKDAPDPIDPGQAAREQAQANRINQFTPFGNLVFFQPGQLDNQGNPIAGGDTVTDLTGTSGLNLGGGDRTLIPGGPGFGQIGGFQGFQTGGGLIDPNQTSNASAVLSLSPELQAIFDQQLGITSSTLGLGQERLNNLGNLPGLISGLDPSIFEGTGAEDVTQALFQQGSRFLDPIFDERERELTTRLANQGIPVGSEAFDFDVLQGLERERGRAFGDLSLQSTLAGGAESRARRQQALGEFLTNAQLRQTSRGQGLNELAQLLGLQQVGTPGLQNFFSPGQVDTTGLLGLNAQQQANQFGAQQGLFSDVLGAGANIGAGFLLGGPFGAAAGGASSLLGGGK